MKVPVHDNELDITTLTGVLFAINASLERDD